MIRSSLFRCFFLFLYDSMKWMMRVCVFVLKSHFMKSRHIHRVFRIRWFLSQIHVYVTSPNDWAISISNFYWLKNIKEGKEISDQCDSFPLLGWHKWASSRYIFALFVHSNIFIFKKRPQSFSVYAFSRSDLLIF